MSVYVEIDDVIGVLNERSGVRGDELWALHDLPCVQGDISLDRLRELASADRDGRVWIMPCKRGDTVYRLVGQKGRKRVEPREVLGVTKYDTTVSVFTTVSDIHE